VLIFSFFFISFDFLKYKWEGPDVSMPTHHTADYVHKVTRKLLRRIPCHSRITGSLVQELQKLLLFRSCQYWKRKLTKEQDKQCTSNVTLRNVRETITAVEGNKCYITCVWICGLRYPACNAHSPYCHLWPAPLYNIFSRYLKKYIYIEHIMCVLISSTTIVWTFSHSKKNWMRYDQKCLVVFV
jgi:hypothetical protein